MRSLPDIVKQLIIVNVLFFLGSRSLGGSAYDLLALHYPQNPTFATWQIVTHMFMHGGVNIFYSTCLAYGCLVAH